MKTHPLRTLLRATGRHPDRWRLSGLRFVTAGVALLGLGALVPTAQAVSSSLVIAEVYGGGGNSGAPYKNDFIVVFNRGTTSVDVNGWTVQYASASGAAWQVTPLATTSKMIPPGGYFLVQEAAGSAGSALPAADATGTINLSGSAGKVALCNNSTALTVANPAGAANLVDFVGFGTTANAFEGAGPTPAPSNTTSAQRGNGGCTDNDQNATDFTTGSPNPRNSSTSLNVCTVTANPPTILTAPASQSVWVTTNVSFTVAAGGDPVLSYSWSVNKGSGFVALANDGAHIAGATSTTLWLTNVSAADAGTYRVTVHSSTTPPDATSDATLSVSYPNPIIVYQPQSQTDLRHTTAFLAVAAQGVPSFNTNYTYTYQWQKNVSGTWTTLSDGGQVSGASTKVLKISNFDTANTGDYQVIVTSTGAAGSLSTTSDTATLSVADSGTLATWDFNNPDMNPSAPAPSQGDAAALAGLVGTADGFQTASTDANDMGTPNNYWGTSSYPNQYVQNKSSGVQFNASTVGYKDVQISFDVRASATASKYLRLQYTTNGTTFIDYPGSVSISGTTFNGPLTYSLAGFANVPNNPNFGFRIVSEFESTATGSANAVYDSVSGTSTYSTSGTLSYDLVKVSVSPLTGHTPPTLSGLTNVVTKDTSPTVQVYFTVTPANGATITSVTASSLNYNVCGDPAVDASFTFMTVSGFADGQAPILVTATDSNGEKASAWFTFTVNPPNIPPTVSGLPLLTNTLVNTALTVPFTVTDDNTPSASLQVSAVSANPTVVPTASVSVSADLGNGVRQLTLTPAAGAAGAVPVSVISTDGGGLSSTNTVVVIVRPSTAVVMNDFFDYPVGSVVSNSFGLWLNHSGTYGQMSVNAAGMLAVASSQSEDVHVPLLGAPYLHTDGSVTLYSSFIASFYGLPSAGGSYFAHFRDENSGALTGFGARVFASTDNAASGKFRLGIGNGSGASNYVNIAQFPMDLSLNTRYLVVSRFVPSTGVATLWVNPVSESSPSVTANDQPQPGEAPNQIDVTSYSFREAGNGEGSRYIDSLRVGTNFAAVLPSATHIDNLSGTTLSYSAGLGARYVLQTNAAGLLAPVWTRVATNATSPGSFSVPAVGSSAAPVFYRIQSE